MIFLNIKLSSSMEFYGIPWNFKKVPWNLSNKISSSMEFHGTLSILPSNFWFPPKCSIIFLNIVDVFDWWLDVIWPKSHRNATYCIDFKIVIRILNTLVSAKMAQGQRKWRAIYDISLYCMVCTCVNIVYLWMVQQSCFGINLYWPVHTRIRQET